MRNKKEEERVGERVAKDSLLRSAVDYINIWKFVSRKIIVRCKRHRTNAYLFKAALKIGAILLSVCAMPVTKTNLSKNL